MSQEVRCPNCGAVSAPGEAFCGECGTRLLAAPSPVPPYAPPPPGGPGGLVTFLRGSGLLVGIVLLLVALLLCSCGGLMAISQEPLTTTEDPAYALGYYMAPVIVCCVPGALLAGVGVLIALFPFAFGRGK